MPKDRKPKGLEILLLLLPVLLFAGVGLYFSQVERDKHAVRKNIVGRWLRQKGHTTPQTFDRKMACEVRGNDLLINDNGYHFPDKQMAYRFVDDNHVQVVMKRDLRLHWIVAVTIHGDNMEWRDNGHPPHIAHFVRDKS